MRTHQYLAYRPAASSYTSLDLYRRMGFRIFSPTGNGRTLRQSRVYFSRYIPVSGRIECAHSVCLQVTVTGYKTPCYLASEVLETIKAYLRLPRKAECEAFINKRAKLADKRKKVLLVNDKSMFTIGWLIFTLRSLPRTANGGSPKKSTVATRKHATRNVNA